MNKLIRYTGAGLLALTVAWVAAPVIFAGEPSGFQVVVHASTSIESMTSKQLSKIFLRKTLSWQDGVQAQPVDQDPKSPVRAAFSLAVHGRSVKSITNYWQRQIFSGRDVPPPELASDQEVLEHVGRVPGAVGYVSSETRIEGEVKILEIRR